MPSTTAARPIWILLLASFISSCVISICSYSLTIRILGLLFLFTPLILSLHNFFLRISFRNVFSKLPNFSYFGFDISIFSFNTSYFLSYSSLSFFLDFSRLPKSVFRSLHNFVPFFYILLPVLFTLNIIIPSAFFCFSFALTSSFHQ